MKKCPRCGEEKEKEEFGRDSYSLDGLNVYCKACIRRRSAKQRKENRNYNLSYAAEYRKKNAETLKEKAKISYYENYQKRKEQLKTSYEKHKQEIAERRAKKRREEEEKKKNRERQKEWRRLNSTAAGKIASSWKKRNPQKNAAHSVVLWAIKSGVIKRKEACEECGMNGKLQGHHEDYTKPMEVTWVCRECHSKKHRKYR